MKSMNISFSQIVIITAVLILSCKDSISVYNPDYESSRPQPAISSISPANGYLAGVDSVIISGTNFATQSDSLTVNFGGSPGVVLSASKTELVVRPGTTWGDDLDVRVSVRGAEFFSDAFQYDLFQPFGVYPGLTVDDAPTSPVAIDGQNNIYSIITTNNVTRYRRISPDGTVTTDTVRAPGDGAPTNVTMRFEAYSDIEVGPGGILLMSQQNIRAIFQKTFGDGLRETVWVASSAASFKIRDMVFDNNGFLWVVGFDSDNIHRFNAASPGGSETIFPFAGQLSSVAFHSATNELFVGGSIDGSQEIWKFTIDGSGNIGAGELYFDFGSNYNGTVSSMVLASNGELLITTGPEVSGVEKPNIVRVFPNGNHQELYPGMLKPGAYSITWRDDRYAVVAIQGDETSINFLDMYDRTRSGIFGF